MPNPCTFAINDVVIGVSALDVVVQLSSNELYRSQVRDQNRLMRLCEQVIDQRRCVRLAALTCCDACLQL